jgi:hypothetical protein
LFSQVVGIKPAEQTEIFRIVAAVLNLGNVEFGGDEESSHVTNTEVRKSYAISFTFSTDATHMCTCARGALRNEMLHRPAET